MSRITSAFFKYQFHHLRPTEIMIGCSCKVVSGHNWFVFVFCPIKITNPCASGETGKFPNQVKMKSGFGWFISESWMYLFVSSQLGDPLIDVHLIEKSHRDLVHAWMANSNDDSSIASQRATASLASGFTADIENTQSSLWNVATLISPGLLIKTFSVFCIYILVNGAWLIFLVLFSAKTGMGTIKKSDWQIKVK